MESRHNVSPAVRFGTDILLTRISETLSTAADDKAASTSLRLVTVLDVLFKLRIRALTCARLVSTAFSRASRRNCVRNAG
jgi:hypothetical protein